MTLEKNLSTEVEKIIFSLKRLGDALIPYNMELEEELIEIIQSLYLYSLIGDFPLITVVGPQGVGKSKMVNTLFKLKDEESLPVGPERCEKIPIILMRKDENSPPTQIYKRTLKAAEIIKKGSLAPIGEIKEILYYDINNLSYSEARERAKNPEKDDAFIFWYVDNLDVFDAVAILPGVEKDAPWVNVIKYILDLSDVVIYTVDFRRKAQLSAKKLEEWLKEANFPKEGLITVFTKWDTMTDEQKESITKEFNPDFYLGIEEEQLKNYEELKIRMREKLFTLPPHTSFLKFKNLIKKARKIIESLEEFIKKKEGTITVEESRALEMAIDLLDEKWNKYIREKILLTAEKVINQEIKVTQEFAYEKAEELFGVEEKILTFISGEINADKINKLGRIIENKFNKEVKERFNDEISNLPEIVVKEGGSLPKLLAIIFTTPIEKQKTILPKELKEEVFGEIISKVSEAVPKREIKEVKKIIISSIKEVITGGWGFVEAAGGGLRGNWAPVAFGLTAFTIISSFIMSTRRAKWVINEFIENYTLEMAKKAKDTFKYHLDSLWEIFKFKFKDTLREKLGLLDDVKNLLSLREAIKYAKDTIYEIKKELFI